MAHQSFNMEKKYAPKELFVNIFKLKNSLSAGNAEAFKKWVLEAPYQFYYDRRRVEFDPIEQPPALVRWLARRKRAIKFLVNLGQIQVTSELYDNNPILFEFARSAVSMSSTYRDETNLIDELERLKNEENSLSDSDIFFINEVFLISLGRGYPQIGEYIRKELAYYITTETDLEALELAAMTNDSSHILTCASVLLATINASERQGILDNALGLAVAYLNPEATQALLDLCIFYDVYPTSRWKLACKIHGLLQDPYCKLLLRDSAESILGLLTVKAANTIRSNIAYQGLTPFFPAEIAEEILSYVSPTLASLPTNI